MGDRFSLEPLLHTNAIITDENDVDVRITKAANLKAIITNDGIRVDRKNKKILSFQPRGIMVQCVNDYPQLKDKTPSWYRRSLFVKFTRTYQGRENKAIKNVYLKDPELLSYVMWRVLNMTHHELSEPASSRIVLEEYKQFNDPVREFFATVVSQETAWTLLPYTYLYELYKAWYALMSPEDARSARNTSGRAS
jgi:putative DNA primase/helicase